MEPRRPFHENRRLRNWIINLMLLVAAVFSFAVAGTITTNVEFHKHEIEQIDDKIDDVLELTATATVSSAILTFLPDDYTTPIAEQLADMSSYFLIALCALYLEKYLVSLIGFASFKVLIPIACGFGIYAVTRNDKFFRNLAIKIGLFALIIYFIIPASVKISDKIYDIYSESIQTTIDSAKQIADEAEASDDQEGFLNGLLDKIQNTTSSIAEYVTYILSKYIEALAVMIVTSCLIPILVLMAFVWLAKLLFSIPISDQNVLDIPENILHRLES